MVGPTAAGVLCKKSPALAWALSSSSRLRRSSASPAQAPSRYAARSAGAGFCNASRKIDASSIFDSATRGGCAGLHETVRRLVRNDPSEFQRNQEVLYS